MAVGQRAIVSFLTFPLLLSIGGCIVANDATRGGRAGGAGGAPVWTNADAGAGAGGRAQDGGADSATSATVAAPRQIAPLSTATVTSQTPTLHWALADGSDGAHIEICRDRACAHPVVAFDADGSRGAPTSNLPAGTLFWRAYGRLAGVTGQSPSPTWQFTVGRRTAPVDTSWGTTLDVNGDGYADIIVGAADAGLAFLYLGGAAGLAISPAVTLSAPDGGGLGNFVASAGDVNGDGYADVIVAAQAASRAYMFLGSATGLTAHPDVTLMDPAGAPPHSFAVHVASAGDVNGDGYADVVVGSSIVGQAYVYLGSATGLASSPAVTLKGDGFAANFGHAAESAGDVNGDGYADVIVGANGTSSSSGEVVLYLGSATGLISTPALTLIAPDGAGSGFGRIACAGDLNGDGYADLVVSADAFGGTVGRVYLYLGNATTGLASSPAVTLDSPDGPGGVFGRLVAGAGDVNGGGYADIIVGADGEAASVSGWAHLYLGGAAGLAAQPAVTLIGPDGPGGWFGRSVAGAGDVNGDGYADVIVGADAGGNLSRPDAGVGSAVGWAHLYLGMVTGLSSDPAITLTGPGDGSAFGISVQ